MGVIRGRGPAGGTPVGRLITENLFGGQTLHGTHALEGFHVKFLLVAEDDVTVGFVGHLFLLELGDVLQGDVGQGFVDALVDVVVDADVLGVQPSVDETELGGALTGQTFGEGFLGDAEGLFALGHFVDDFKESIILSFWVMMWVKKNSGWSL